MKKRNAFAVLGIILIVVGVAALVYGYTTYTQLQSDIANRFAKAISGSSEQENQALYVTIAGAAGTILGLVFIVSNRKKRRKKRRR